MAKKLRYLTERQREILDYLQSYQAEHGVAPTHREICDRFGYSSFGTVYKHLKLLQQKGYIRRDWNQKRGIELVRSASGAPTRTEVDLPFYGRIAAGRPIEAVAGDEHIGVPRHLLGRRTSGHYVLEVIGESMIDEGIHEGDLVIVSHRQEAETGEMVVALVDDEATLKRFYPEGRKVRLQPANPHMKPLYFPAQDVQVQGVVVGLMRRF